MEQGLTIQCRDHATAGDPRIDGELAGATAAKAHSCPDDINVAIPPETFGLNRPSVRVHRLNPAIEKVLRLHFVLNAQLNIDWVVVFL